jgi:hypothetical protein
MEIALPALDADAALAHGVEIAAEQEMNIVSVLRESPAVVKADRAGTDDRDARTGW